jgi:hypothetical protein
MPIGNALAAIRSINRDLIPEVSSFNRIGGVNSLYVEHKFNSNDVIWMTLSSHYVLYINTNSANPTLNQRRTFSYSRPTNRPENTTLGHNNPFHIIKNYSNNFFLSEKRGSCIKRYDELKRTSLKSVETGFGNFIFGSKTGLSGNSGGLIANPERLAVDSFNNMYLLENNTRILKLKDPEHEMNVTGYLSYEQGISGGTMTIFAGGVTTGSADGLSTEARFNGPKGITVDLDDNIYVADTLNHTIRKITLDGNVTTIAGSAGSSGYVDDVGTNARFDNPHGLCCDFDGNIYVADSANFRVRKISPSQNYAVTTIAGNGTSSNTQGDNFSVGFGKLTDIVMMHDGNLLVLDETYREIKKIKNKTGYRDTFNITLSSSIANLVLENHLYRRGWDGSSPVNCTLTILSGAYIYSKRYAQHNSFTSKSPSLSIGDCFNNSTITIINSGGIIGGGGFGSKQPFVDLGTKEESLSGTDAIYTRSNIVVKNYGIIGGGGGGGGTWLTKERDTRTAAGGGGAGLMKGIARYRSEPFNTYGAQNGTILSGGKSSTYRFVNNISSTEYILSGGDGGDLGQNSKAGRYYINTTSGPDTTGDASEGANPGGEGSYYYSGGPAGKAIDGISFVTIDPSSTGQILGGTV